MGVEVQVGDQGVSKDRGADKGRGRASVERWVRAEGGAKAKGWDGFGSKGWGIYIVVVSYCRLHLHWGPPLRCRSREDDIYVVYDGKLFCIPEFLTVFGHLFLHRFGIRF